MSDMFGLATAPDEGPPNRTSPTVDTAVDVATPDAVPDFVALVRPAVGAGRTRITARALQRVATAATAEALGVDARGVDVDLRDRNGELDLVASTPIGVVPLDRAIAEPRSVQRSGGSVLERCTAAEHLVRARMHEIAGCRVQRVTLRLTGVQLAGEHRVR